LPTIQTTRSRITGTGQELMGVLESTMAQVKMLLSQQHVTFGEVLPHH